MSDKSSNGWFALVFGMVAGLLLGSVGTWMVLSKAPPPVAQPVPRWINPPAVQITAPTPVAPPVNVDELLLAAEEAFAGEQFDEACRLAHKALKAEPTHEEAAGILRMSLMAMPTYGDAALRQKLEQKVSFDFMDTPLPDAVTFLKALTGLPVMLDPQLDAPKKTLVTLKMNDMKLGQALDWIATQAEAEIAHAGGILFLGSKQSASKVAQKPVAETIAIEILAQDSKAPSTGFLLHPSESGRVAAFCTDGKGHSVTLQGYAYKWMDAAPAGPDGIPDDKAPEWLLEMHKRLAKPVSFDFVETSLADAVQFLQQTSNATIILQDQVRVPDSTLMVKDTPLGRVLGWLNLAADVKCVVSNGAIVIGKREAIEQSKGDVFEVIPVEIDVVGRQTASGFLYRNPTKGVFHVIAADAEGNEVRFTGYERGRANTHEPEPEEAEPEEAEEKE